jgi:uroporphyrinogen-III synthase
MGALVRLVILTLGDEAHSVPTPSGVLHVRASAATLDHDVLPLSPNGLAILRRLARNPGEVVSRDRLLEVLPGDSADPHTAEVAVARLREALSPYLGSHPLVRTVIKRGYVLQTS